MYVCIYRSKVPERATRARAAEFEGNYRTAACIYRGRSSREAGALRIRFDKIEAARTRPRRALLHVGATFCCVLSDNFVVLGKIRWYGK